MCGINGFNWESEELIESMNIKLIHRGPDDQGKFVNKGVSLGHLRLSILDLTNAGHQPMFYSKENGACSEKYNSKLIKKSNINIVFNGEIYNFKEIKEELTKKGYLFKTSTDTEVVLASYLEYGINCVKKFNGMWSFCIYDQSKNILFCSRDRFGIKPFYYYFRENKLIFSSELKGIFEHNIRKEVNESSVSKYFILNSLDNTPQTFFKGICKLMPGHNLIYNIIKKNIKLYNYYDLKKEFKIDRKETFKELFKNSVRLRLISDVEVGSCLSGGLDSSSIVCQVKELCKNEDFQTFSLVFPGEIIDESKFQQKVIEKTNFIWNKKSFDIKNIIKDLDDLVYTQEEPFPTFSMYGQYLLMKLAKEKKIKVILDGQGADEILCGYHNFFSVRFKELFLRLKWFTLLKEVFNYIGEYKSIKPLLYLIAIFFPKTIVFLRKKNLNKYLNLKNTNDIDFKKYSPRTVTDHSINNEIFLSLPQLLRYEDKNSMRWGVESRIPFCDYRLVEKTISLMTNDKISNNMTKIVLRKAMKNILPEAIRLRKDKLGFESPDFKFLKSNKGRKLFNDFFRSDAFINSKYYKQSNIKKLYISTLKNKKDYSRFLWKIFLFHKWYEKWIN